MTVLEELIVKTVRRLYKDQYAFNGVVVSVDKEAKSCLVNDAGTERPARLVCVTGSGDNATVIYPVVGSYVSCILLFNDPMQAQVVGYTEVDEWLLNGGHNGPMIVYEKLLQEYNKTREVVDAIASALTQWAPAPGDGGTALKTLITPALTGKSTGDFAADGITNDKMKH